MLFLKVKDFGLRQKFKQLELQKIIYKYIKTNVLIKSFMLKGINKKKPYLFKAVLKKAIKGNSKTRIVRRCILTNRGRGSFRTHLISRNIFRELLQFGVIPGYKKAVW